MHYKYACKVMAAIIRQNPKMIRGAEGTIDPSAFYNRIRRTGVELSQVRKFFAQLVAGYDIGQYRHLKTVGGAEFAAKPPVGHDKRAMPTSPTLRRIVGQKTSAGAIKSRSTFYTR